MVNYDTNIYLTLKLQNKKQPNCIIFRMSCNNLYFWATYNISTVLNLVEKELEDKFLNDFEANQNIVHKVCRIYTTNQDAHNDLFQEITIQLWKNYSKFRGEAKFSTWMYRVALNTAISLYRKSTRTIQTQDITEYSFKIKAEDYDDTEELQLKALYNAIRQLNDIDKALIFLYLEDKSYKEISNTLGISEVNARVKMNRAKDKLKKVLNP
ncbi:RNA polymerase sigma-70 factor (ECF subfamily) [Tenacibaculum caenipelagi]|uniref:RNA polymerase sigma-70 factor (ECF subfamily) n=1 Tax=Tenacibaculum caenipelagi TaxID=1325435 RepID=A0A4R6TDI5_9FLAO|nr:RNA polymerase sigma-70 factor (ECF subfamily) [Tenacibaculum caenipelagi]